MSLSLAGSIAPELRKLLGTMSDVEKKAKGVEKSLGTFAAPIAKAVAEARRLSLALAGIKTRATGIERDFGRWGAAAGKSSGELRNVRTTLDGLKSSARSVSSSMGTWSGGIGRANRQLQGTVTALNRAARAGQSINVNGGGAGVPSAPTGRRSRYTQRGSHGNSIIQGAGYSTGDAVVHGGVRATGEGVEYAAKGVQEKLKQKNSGLTPDESAQLQRDSFQLSAKHPSMAPLDIQELGRNLVANVEDAKSMLAVLPSYVKAAVSLQTSAGTKGAVKELDLVAKAIDNSGKSMSPKSTEAMLQGYLRSKQLDSTGTKGNDLLNFTKTAQSSGKARSDEWYADVYPTLAFGQGGSRTGTAVATAMQNMVIGRATGDALMEQAALGLREGLVMGTTKAGKRFVKNKGTLKEEALFNSNDYEWNKKVLQPALIARGLVPKGWAAGDFREQQTEEQRGGVAKATSSFSSDRTSANLFTIYNTDSQQIEANKKKLALAPGASSVMHDQARDPFIAVEAMFSQLKSAFGLLAEPAVAAAAQGLASVAGGIAKINEAVSNMPEGMRNAASGAAAAGAIGVGVATGAVVAKGIGKAIAPVGNSLLTGALGANTAKGIGSTLRAGAALGRSGMLVGGAAFGLHVAGANTIAPGAEEKLDRAKRFVRGQGSEDERKKTGADVEASSKALREGVWNFIKRPFTGGLDEQRPAAPAMAPGATGPRRPSGPVIAAAPGAPDATANAVPAGAPAAIQQAGTAIGNVGTAATAAAPGVESTATGINSVATAAAAAAGGLTSTASGIQSVSAAAAGAGGALATLAGQIRALGAVSPGGAAKPGGAPSAAPAGGGGAPSAAPAPGKSSSYVPPPRSSAPIQVTSTLTMDGRTTAKGVTRHIMTANNTRNGTQGYDSNGLKTPVGYSSPVQA